MEEQEFPKLKPPVLIGEASQLDHDEGGVTPEGRRNAHLGCLYGLILEDTDFGHLKHDLMRLSSHDLAGAEDTEGLSKLLAKAAEEIGIQPNLLAWAAIMWANEADIHPFEIKGSADWFDLPATLQNERAALRAELKKLTDDIDTALRGAGLDPESAVRVAAERASTLTRRLRILEKKIQGVKQRRSRLMTELRTYQIEAYYLKRIRRKKLDDAQVQSLLQRALDDPTYLTRHRRVPTQKTLYDWVAAVDRVLASLIE